MSRNQIGGCTPERINLDFEGEQQWTGRNTSITNIYYHDQVYLLEVSHSAAQKTCIWCKQIIGYIIEGMLNTTNSSLLIVHEKEKRFIESICWVIEFSSSQCEVTSYTPENDSFQNLKLNYQMWWAPKRRIWNFVQINFL